MNERIKKILEELGLKRIDFATGCTFHSRLHPNFVLVLNLPVNVQLVTSAANLVVNESMAGAPEKVKCSQRQLPPAINYGL